MKLRTSPLRHCASRVFTVACVPADRLRLSTRQICCPTPAQERAPAIVLPRRQSLGYRESDVEGSPIVVVDIVAQYKSEGFHGETMVLQMVPADFNRYGFDLQFRMSDRYSAREVALGKIGIVFINRADRKVTPHTSRIYGQGRGSLNSQGFSSKSTAHAGIGNSRSPE